MPIPPSYNASERYLRPAIHRTIRSMTGKVLVEQDFEEVSWDFTLQILVFHQLCSVFPDLYLGHP